MIDVMSSVGAVMDSVVYAVSNGLSEKYYLIDIGDFDAALSILPKGAIICGVFVTHGHHDHINGLNKLKKAFPECTVYASEKGAKMLQSPKDNLSFYIEKPFAYDGEVNILHDGDRVELFEGITLEVVSTPGHHPSCLSFLIDNYIFTGDSYIPDVSVVTNLPGGNKRIAMESVAKIIEIGKGKTICPGHNVNRDDNL